MQISAAKNSMSVNLDARAPARFVVGATTLYAQLESVLRHRILGGEWAYGESMPSIEELCAQYGVARTTVRQALQLIADEGLILSQRGRRASVIWTGDQNQAAPLYSSGFTGLNSDVPNYEVRVLSRKQVDVLPSSRWKIGRDEGPYMHIRKVDRDGEQPYGLSSVYLAKDLFKRFPPGADSKAKLAQLALKYAKPALNLARERLTVEPADYDSATALNCPMSAPVVRVLRVFCDSTDRVAYYGISVYRGDRFRLERDMTEYLQVRT